jgi:hypothetical protein
LVRPGTKILDRESSRLRELNDTPESGPVEIFIGLFDAILALAEQRIEAGQAGELERAHSLELLIADLAEQQSAAARRAGLRACMVGFTQALGGQR